MSLKASTWHHCQMTKEIGGMTTLTESQSKLNVHMLSSLTLKIANYNTCLLLNLLFPFQSIFIFLLKKKLVITGLPVKLTGCTCTLVTSSTRCRAFYCTMLQYITSFPSNKKRSTWKNKGTIKQPNRIDEQYIWSWPLISLWAVKAIDNTRGRFFGVEGRMLEVIIVL